MVFPIIAGAVALVILLLSFPAIYKVFQFAFFTDFSFGSPLVIGLVVLFLFIMFLRTGSRRGAVA